MDLDRCCAWSSSRGLVRSSLTGKAGGMDRDRFANILRGSGAVHRDTQADKSPPELSEPAQAEDNESVLHHAAWQLVTGNRQFQQGAPSGCQPHRQIYILVGVGKLVMGEPGGKNNHGFPPEVVQAPRRQPLPLGGPSTAGGWLDQKPGARFVLPLRQWEVPPAILLLSTSMSQYASSSLYASRGAGRTGDERTPHLPLSLLRLSAQVVAFQQG